MTSKQFLSFFSGLILTALIYALIIGLFFFYTFSFSGERYSEIETRDALLFYTSLILSAVMIYIVVNRFKTGRRFSAMGICVPLLFAICGCLAMGWVYTADLIDRPKFEKSVWAMSNRKPFNMAKTLTKDKTLIGIPRQEIIELLGNTKDSNPKDNRIVYWTDKETWQLRVELTKDRVSDIYLYEEGLDL